MRTYITLASLVGLASAACPNSCSGHGTCNNYDQCTCFLETPIALADFDGPANTIEVEWTGADCSRRTCARGISWSASDPTDANTLACMHAKEAECSDQGLCDRATGICACFPGYTGSACQRTSCPDDCSGHGTCRSNRDFAYDWAVAKTFQFETSAYNGGEITEAFRENYHATYDKAWDSALHYGCLCDAGYRGPSCAMVECPSAQDPLDDKCGLSNDDPLDPNKVVPITDYQLQYDAPFGAQGWEDAYSAGAASDGKTEKNIGESQASKESDYNKQYILNKNGRKVYGCYGQMSGQDCSGRGICDYSSGTCKCFSGYAGTACEGVEEMA